MGTINYADWKWLNESQIINAGEEIVIYAPAKTDWFNNPIPEANGEYSKPVANAPFYYTDVEGDFVFSVKVRPNHKYVYDACAIMVIEDEMVWAKAAFEKSDFGTNAAVCVATNQISDDANGCNIEQDYVWLKVCRVGNVFSSHYSLDGKTYNMVRLFTLPAKKSIKVGIEAQSPAGEGGLRYYSDMKLELRTVENLRSGE